MTGETNLRKLLSSLSPVLLQDEYVFCTLPDSPYGAHAELQPIASCMEPEGLTLMVPRSNADARGIPYDSVFRCITLTVHSSLEAVGLTAAVAGALAERGMSANVVAGYYHDHIFVPVDQAERALVALAELARRSIAGR